MTVPTTAMPEGQCDLTRAVTFAVIYHGTQVRKGTTIPYSSHLLQVAGLVLEHGGDLSQAAAGVLHDVVEDTAATLADVETHFGSDIAGIVADCTDTTPGEVYGKKRPWRERKAAYLGKLTGVSPRSALVIACDKLHNMRTQVAELEHVGLSAADKFNAPPIAQRWLHRGLLEALRVKVPGPLYGELAALVSRYAVLTNVGPHELEFFRESTDQDTALAEQWGTAVLEVADFVGRGVRWPGSMGDYFVIKFAGFAASGRGMWTCLAPSGNIVNVMVPSAGLVHYRTIKPAAVAKYEAQEYARSMGC